MRFEDDARHMDRFVVMNVHGAKVIRAFLPLTAKVDALHRPDAIASSRLVVRHSDRVARLKSSVTIGLVLDVLT